MRTTETRHCFYIRFFKTSSKILVFVSAFKKLERQGRKCLPLFLLFVVIVKKVSTHFLFLFSSSIPFSRILSIHKKISPHTYKTSCSSFYFVLEKSRYWFIYVFPYFFSLSAHTYCISNNLTY